MTIATAETKQQQRWRFMKTANSNYIAIHETNKQEH